MPGARSGRVLGLGLIGCGWIAERHAQAACNQHGVKIVVVSSRTRERAEAFARPLGAAWTTDWEDVAAHPAVDAIVIGSPNVLHAPQAIAAMAAGKHVLVEKPMATTLADADAMVETARAHGRVLLAGHMWRYRQEVIAFRDAVRSGRFGAIERTRSHGCHVDFAPSGWFLEPAMSGGGALIDLGVHAVDTTRFVLDEPVPERVTASIVESADHPGIDARGLLTIEWATGVSSEIDFGWWRDSQDGLIADTEVWGERGYGRIWEPEPAPGYEHGSLSMYNAQMQDFVQRSSAHPPGSDGFEAGLCEPGRTALAIALEAYAVGATARA
jgi:predicted dehydrogenase